MTVEHQTLPSETVRALPSAATESGVATDADQPRASSGPAMSPKRSSRDTDAGTLSITEIHPGEAYEVQLGDAVLFRTSVGYLMEHPLAYPGVVPEIMGAFRGAPPFNEVIVLQWVSYGNACETSGFTFISIASDGFFALANLDVCTSHDLQIDASANPARIVIPATPAGMSHGQMHPPIPGDEWVLHGGKLRHLRKITELLPHQVVEDP